MTVETAPNTLPLSYFLLGAGEKGLLRFSTAGSVDDGKSTLIGRLLFDTKGAFDDQIEAVKNSKLNRSTGKIDFSLLTDGLRAEREQGITIDVAYRYFATARRKFIIADTPGHEQYTRNMATGASTADVAVILVDARKGVLPQSRRHACISSLLGIRHLVVAVNKMDLVDFSAAVFESIREDFETLAPALGHPAITYIPLSALEGDNVVERSPRTPWYAGPSLLEYLETVPVDSSQQGLPTRFPVQYVIRPHLDFRGFAGQLSSGSLRTGDAVMALPSGHTSRIKEIVTFDGNLETAVAPMSVTVTLEDEIDISRGDMLVHPEHPPELGRRVEATLVWMNEQPLETGKTYLLQHGPLQVTARVTEVRHRLDVEALKPHPASTLSLNDIGHVIVETTRPLAFDSYHLNRKTGAFVLIDALTNLTLAAGLIERGVALRKAERRTEFATGPVTAAERLDHWGHTAALIRVAARPDLALPLERALFELGGHTLVLSRPVQPLGVLLEAGLLVITSLPVETEFNTDEWNLPEDSEAACQEVILRLREQGVLKTTDQLYPGEGI